MPIKAKTFRMAIVCLAGLLTASAQAEGIDTEHLFGFMIGTDIGNVGEREFQSQMTGRFAKNGGNYRAIGQELELEFVPARNFRIQLGSTFASHGINRAPGPVDHRALSSQRVSVD